MRLFSIILGYSLVGVSYPSAEMQSVYSTASADWAVKKKENSEFKQSLLHLELIECYMLLMVEGLGKDRLQS